MLMRQKVKKSFQSGNKEAARIYAEKAIQRRNQSRYYQAFSARLSPMVDVLKNKLKSNNTEPLQSLNDLPVIMEDVNRINNHNNASEVELQPSSDIIISPKEIDNLLQQLNDEMAVELSNRLPSTTAIHDDLAFSSNINSEQQQQIELEQRLAKLRRRP